MVALIAAPALYLAMPLLLSIDLIPSGFTSAVLPKAASEQGRGFVRRVMSELEGAIDRAGDAIEAEEKAAGRQDQRPGTPADPSADETARGSG